jgi:hypothetical protein
MPKPETPNQMMAEYDKVLQEAKKRHIAGQAKYGEFSFLNREMKEDMIDELLDFINYGIYWVIKLRYFEEEYKAKKKDETM